MESLVFFAAVFRDVMQRSIPQTAASFELHSFPLCNPALDVTNQNLVLISKLFATLGTSQSQNVSYIGEEHCVRTLKTAAKVTKVGYTIRVFFSPSRLLL